MFPQILTGSTEASIFSSAMIQQREREREGEKGINQVLDRGRKEMVSWNLEPP
jgi:hypothetical protein